LPVTGSLLGRARYLVFIGKKICVILFELVEVRSLLCWLKYLAVRMPSNSSVKDRRSSGINVVCAFVNLPVKHDLKFFLWSSVLVVDYVVHCSCFCLFDVDMNERLMVYCCLFQKQIYTWINIEQLSVGLSAIGGSCLTGSVLGWLYIMCFWKRDFFFLYYSMLAFWI